jgi:tetratricopeptide (TPR) repeat protein
MRSSLGDPGADGILASAARSGVPEGPRSRDHQCSSERCGRHLVDKRGIAPPIFIHSSWRVSHTWFWLKFRHEPSTVCFYEPFHERLATLTRSEALTVVPESWDSGHPRGQPYFLEFLPLIRNASGVRLFVPEIPYQWFIPIKGFAGHLRPEETKYLALLVRHANRRQKIPVFGFSRSLGRLLAIKKQFPGFHIFQYRNPWTQWISFLYHGKERNSYFIEKMLTLMFGAEDPFLSAIINRYLMHSVARGDRSKIEGRRQLGNSPRQIGKEFAELLPERDLFSIHMAFHTYLYMCARLSADLVVDASKLARDRDYRVLVHHQIASVTGLHLNLDDATDTQQYHSFDASFINWEEIRKNLNFAVLTLDHLFDRQNLLRIGTELIDQTLAEVQISEKYLAKARDQIKTLTSERDSIKVAKDTLVTESDRLAGERDAALAERDRLAGERDAAIANVDRFTREWVAAASERDQLISDKSRLEGELAQATIAATQSASQIARLRSEVTRLSAEYERVAGELFRGEAARKAAQHEIEQRVLLSSRMSVEKDRLEDEVAAAIAAHAAQASLLAALRADLARLCADRDRVAAQNERWFNAAAQSPAKDVLISPLSSRPRWSHRLFALLRAGSADRCDSRSHRKESSRTRANRARDAGQWELAARFFGDELDRDPYAAAIWVQFGHALKEAGRISEAETAYRNAVSLGEEALDTLLALGHALTLQDKRAEAAQIYARTLDLSPPFALRSAILNQLDVLGSPIGIARAQV